MLKSDYTAIMLRREPDLPDGTFTLALFENNKRKINFAVRSTRCKSYCFYDITQIPLDSCQYCGQPLSPDDFYLDKEISQYISSNRRHSSVTVVVEGGMKQFYYLPNYQGHECKILRGFDQQIQEGARAIAGEAMANCPRLVKSLPRMRVRIPALDSRFLKWSRVVQHQYLVRHIFIETKGRFSVCYFVDREFTRIEFCTDTVFVYTGDAFWIIFDPTRKKVFSFSLYDSRQMALFVDQVKLQWDYLYNFQYVFDHRVGVLLISGGNTDQKQEVLNKKVFCLYVQEGQIKGPLKTLEFEGLTELWPTGLLNGTLFYTKSYLALLGGKIRKNSYSRSLFLWKGKHALQALKSSPIEVPLNNYELQTTNPFVIPFQDSDQFIVIGGDNREHMKGYRDNSKARHPVMMRVAGGKLSTSQLEPVEVQEKQFKKVDYPNRYLTAEFQQVVPLPRSEGVEFLSGHNYKWCYIDSDLGNRVLRVQLQSKLRIRFVPEKVLTSI